jgi:hypothetical protein
VMASSRIEFGEHRFSCVRLQLQLPATWIHGIRFRALDI